MYYQGSLYTTPNVRPWSLQRNGYPGIAQWGGWVWSGDTESSWKTLEGQVAVGINYSLSIGPYWGSDIGGFYSNHELTGELYARWFQFAAFCGSFRSHGRTWHTRLPWGWGLDYLGYVEDRVPPLESELNNQAIEPITKKYDELMDSLRLAYIAFNAPHFADFVVEVPTPVMEGSKQVASVYHFSELHSFTAKNKLFALGKI